MKILFVLIVISISYLYMIMPRVFFKKDFSKFKGVHYAHRGWFNNKGDSPENSLLAFKKAVSEGMGIELDVVRSKDGVPVVFHDASLKRMCGVDKNIWECSLDELKTLKLVKSNQTIPTF